MRRLLLMRHAKSDWSTGGQRDLDRPLAARGRSTAPLIGRYIAAHGLAPDRVLVSPARRTRETWELVAPALGRQPAFAYEPRLYEARPDMLLAVLKETAPQVQTLMVIGHNPGLQEVAGRLVGSGDADARFRLAEKFPTGGLAVIDFPTDHWLGLKPSLGRLDRFVSPRLVACEAG